VLCKQLGIKSAMLVSALESSMEPYLDCGNRKLSTQRSLLVPTFFSLISSDGSSLTLYTALGSKVRPRKTPHSATSPVTDLVLFSKSSRVLLVGVIVRVSGRFPALSILACSARELPPPWEKAHPKNNPRVVSRSAQLGKSLRYGPERAVDQCASTDAQRGVRYVFLTKVKIASSGDKHASNCYCLRSNEAEKRCGEISSMTAFSSNPARWHGHAREINPIERKTEDRQSSRLRGRGCE